jgi:acyl-coenzyme A synthetase/AMP-(fatty) acid ligase
MHREKVEFASATPSFWRLLLHSAATQTLSQSNLIQITIGGEAVDQPLLDSLHQAFPSARLTHIYASTEMGTCFSVSDGRAGFPADYLANPALPCQLRIGSEGELEILSRRRMLGYFSDSARRSNGQSKSDSSEETWFATGDIVERRGDRILFVGRKSDTINVGGAKVFPADVERCISSVPGVLQVRVYGISSSLTGQLVAAEVQPSGEINPDSLLSEILTSCRAKLARHQVPAKVSFCSQMPTNASGKMVRKEVLHGG